MRIAGVIIAGGKSSRMGQEKALMTLGGKPLVSHIVERIAPQVATVILNANGDMQRFEQLGLTVIPDRRSDIETPLAGLHSALGWAKESGFDAVLSVPSDEPFVPRDLAARLTGDMAAVATSGGQTHYLTGFWPTKLLPLLEESFFQDRHSRESGNPAYAVKRSGPPAFAGVTVNKAKITQTTRKVRRVQDWVAACDARIVDWSAQPFDPFFNVNTPQELAEAERIAAEFKP